MIDGIKTGYLPLDVEELSNTLGIALDRKTVYCNRNGMIFGFTEMVDTDTGELRYMCGLRGSVHKYANHGTHNADAFRMSDLCRVFTELKELYGIRPNATRLLSVEFGVNLKLPYSPQRIIQAARMYRTYQFTPMGDIGIEYKADAFRLKIYDKGKQCKLHEFENVLRVEVKAERNYLKKRGVHIPMLGDLLNVDVWELLEAILLDAVDCITFVETVSNDGITKKESDLLSLFTGNGWQTLDKVQRCRKKKKLSALMQRLGSDGMNSQLKRMISEECERLRNYTPGNATNTAFLETDKIKSCYKSEEAEPIKNATNTAFLEPRQKRQKCNQCGFKIKGAKVAMPPLESTPLTDCINPTANGMKLSDTPTSEIKTRGKPPNVGRFNAG